MIESQKERKASLARAVDPFAKAPATIAALIAPAVVPLSRATAILRLASNASNTPQVNAPHDPPPCSARPMGFRIVAGRRRFRRSGELMLLVQEPALPLSLELDGDALHRGLELQPLRGRVELYQDALLVLHRAHRPPPASVAPADAAV